MIAENELKLVKLSGDQLLIEFLIFIDRDFKVKAFRGSTRVNIRVMIDSFHC